MVKLHYKVEQLSLFEDAEQTLSPWLHYLFTHVLTPLYDRAWEKHLIYRREVTGKTLMLVYIAEQYGNLAGYDPHHERNPAQLGMPLCMIRHVERRVNLVVDPSAAGGMPRNDENDGEHEVQY